MSMLAAPINHTPLAFSKAVNPRAAAIASGFGAVSPQQIQAIADKVLATLAREAGAPAAADQQAQRAEQERPALRKPDMQRLQHNAARQAGGPAAGRMTPEAALGYYTSLLSSLLATENNNDLKTQLELVRGRLQSRAAAGQRVSDALSRAQGAVEAAAGQGEAAAAELDAAQAALRAAQDEVLRLTDALANAGPGEEEPLRAALAAAQSTLQQVVERVGGAQQAVGAALQALSAALQQLDVAEQGVDAFAAVPLATPPKEDMRTNDARLSELLAILQEIVGKANDAKLASDMKLLQEVLKAREAENLRRSQDYQEQLEKAERAQKTMGCIGKIIGWVLVVVAVVIAVVDFGVTSSVLAGIGLALAIAEEAGLNITGKIVDPIIQMVMKAVKAVAGVVGNVMENMGLDAEFVKKIQTVVAAVLVAAVVIVALFGAKKLGEALAARLMSKIAQNSGVKMVKQLVTRVSASVNKSVQTGIAKATGSSADDIAIRIGMAAKAAQAMQLASMTSQSVGTIVVADMHVKAARLLADLELGLADTKIFRDVIQKLLEYFVSTNRTVQELFQLMVDAQATDYETARFITQRIARA